MITPKPKDEALEIIEIIDKYFPKIFEAHRSIEWLHKHTRQGKQPEWQGFFFEEYSFPLLTNFLGGWYGVRIIKGSRIDYQRHYNWDLKVHSLKDKNGKAQTGIILNDKAALDRIIKTESGIGFIICLVDFTFDTSGRLQLWRDKLENRKKPHSKPHVMKNIGKVKSIIALFIKDEKMLQQGLKTGWIEIHKQGKQLTGQPRNLKYSINLKKLPKNLIISQFS
ncbi:MAG: hypothetical protein IIA82_04985 [Thaumarchaeota archaeon]|nr:hypothetical protein [Nitrososphaerota archaeon]